MERTEKYRCCLVLPGGGFRFGYYLGVYAAAEDSGHQPDMLLASCGGAIAAAVIAGLPDTQARLDWLQSADMYCFLRNIQPTDSATPLRVLGGAVGRWLDHAMASRITDLFRGYLFDLPTAPPLPGVTRGCGPAIAIVGARLLYRACDSGMKRGDRQLFAEIVFCPRRAAALLHGSAAPAADPRWSGGAIAPILELECGMPVAEAARISMADMVYFRSHAWAAQHYTGGVIDLFPIELAHRLADEVVMERKAPFNPLLALPALRSVLGIDGAARLRHVHSEHAHVWVDTRDVTRALRDHSIRKKVDWRRNRISLLVPDTHAAYTAQVRAQWEYGYRKGMAAFVGEQS